MRWLYTIDAETQKAHADLAERMAGLFLQVIRPETPGDPGRPWEGAVPRNADGGPDVPLFLQAYADKSAALLPSRRGKERAALERSVEMMKRFHASGYLERYLLPELQRNERVGAGKAGAMHRWAEICFERALNEEALRARFVGERPPVFEQALYDEHRKRGFQLDQLNRSMQAHGHADFDAHRLFDETALAQGRVMRSSPIVVAYYTPYQAEGYDGKFPWQPVGGTCTVEGFLFGFGFAHRRTIDRAGQEKTLWDPAIFLDSRVLGELQRQEEAAPDSDAGLAVDLLSSMRAIWALSVHDYIHTAMWPDVGAYLLPHAPGMPRRRENDIEQGAAHGGAFAPIYAGNPYQDVSYSGVEATERFNERVYWRPWPHHSAQVPANGSFDGTMPIELHAEAVHRDAMGDILGLTESPYTDDADGADLPYGLRVKRGIVGVATRFLDRLEDFRRDAEKERGKDVADRMASYLAVLAMGRLFRVIEMEDPMLTQERFALSGGRTMSFAEVAEQLRLPPFRFAEHEAEYLHNPATALHLPSDFVSQRARKTLLTDPSSEELALLMLRHNDLPEELGLKGSDPGQLRLALAIARTLDAAVLSGNHDKILRGWNQLTGGAFRNGYVPDVRVTAAHTARVLLDVMDCPPGATRHAQQEEDRAREALRAISAQIDESPEMRAMLRAALGKAAMLNEDLEMALNTMRAISWEGDQKPYIVRKAAELMAREDGEGLRGMDGLLARTLVLGSSMPATLRDIAPWRDPDYPTATVSQNYQNEFLSPSLSGRPAFAEARQGYRAYVSERESGGGGRQEGAS